MSNEESPVSGDKSKFLTAQSISFPALLAVITGLKVSAAPIFFVILLGGLGAVAILTADILKTTIPQEHKQKLKWWAARLSIWLFNTAVVIGSVIFSVGNGS
ncbi:MAG: hypothetical protein KAT18_06775 [Candidatus Latescibacteria bacterium]|nr:hypothetical protein [Candidatus Latescibacterota bacterium]